MECFLCNDMGCKTCRDRNAKGSESDCSGLLSGKKLICCFASDCDGVALGCSGAEPKTYDDPCGFACGISKDAKLIIS